MYVLQDQNLEYYFLADLDSENLLFGKAVQENEFNEIDFANHEPSFKNPSGEIFIPDNLYLLSGKEQIANSSQLQELSLLVDKNTRCLLYTSPSPRDVRSSRMPSSA